MNAIKEEVNDDAIQHLNNGSINISNSNRYISNQRDYHINGAESRDSNPIKIESTDNEMPHTSYNESSSVNSRSNPNYAINMHYLHLKIENNQVI